MTKPTPSSEARDLRDLLEAVREAVTLEHGTPDYERRLAARALWVRTVLTAICDGSSTNISWETGYLRTKLAAEQAAAEAKAARKTASGGEGE